MPNIKTVVLILFLLVPMIFGLSAAYYVYKKSAELNISIIYLFIATSIAYVVIGSVLFIYFFTMWGYKQLYQSVPQTTQEHLHMRLEILRRASEASTHTLSSVAKLSLLTIAIVPLGVYSISGKLSTSLAFILMAIFVIVIWKVK